jgi:hypothetical protein
MNNRLQQIKNAVKLVQAEKRKLAGIERQVVMLSDLEYVTIKKSVTENNELNFN